MMQHRFDLIFFDMMGTTIQDTSSGFSLILESFSKAFIDNGIKISIEELNQQRGKSKIDAIRSILSSQDPSEEKVEKIYKDFLIILEKSLTKLTEIPGTTKVFNLLIGKKIKIAIGSGLPLDLINKIIPIISWPLEYFDFIGSSELYGKGRPDPIMIMDCMEKLKLNDKLKILKVGDTIVDIQEGKNAGVLTAAVLTGTQKREDIEKCNPDYIFSDITQILKVI